MSEPDLRILQANERTYLAWARTGIALMVFGFALARVAVWLEAPVSKARDSTLLVAIGVALVIVGASLPAFAAFRHSRIKAAIVRGETIIPSDRPNWVIATLLLTAGLGLAGWLIGG
jgi:putative membrane protein